MPTNSKRRSPSWQQLLFLILFGAGIGYPCFENLPIWGVGGGPLAIVGFLVGALAFISGLLGFFAIAIKTITSSAEKVPANAASSGAMVMPHGNVAAALAGLRVVVVGVIVLACFDVWYCGGPSLTSGYGRSRWTEIIMTLLLSRLPYVVALIRIRRAADRAGLALIMAAGMVQSFSILLFGLRYHYAHQVAASWPWLTISLCLVAGIFAAFAWRSAPSCKGDVGILFSIFFGFVAYTVLSAIFLAALGFELRKL